ncbi:XdhC family protein [Robertmurraya massiliosenegalensis]|uniref:XdhC family protein n=1 Tax=Robertmurraya massiliosenegalensis TaxID=1287657 RepID=UPI0003604F51|nr:XdhC family protein [Robertmurraya massiliosenegalensis]
MMLSTLKILESIQDENEKCILATIIQIEGSAYLREGTFMIIKENGEKVGMLSAGCLEEDLLLRCREIFQTEIPQTVIYDTSAIDDVGWGQGMGCNGVIRILVEPITQSLHTSLLSVKEALVQGYAVYHEKEFSEDFTVKKSAFEIIDEDLVTSSLPTFYRTDEGYRFTYYFTPPPILCVFGAGEDAITLVDLASKIGFIVKLCDWRSGLCNEECFPNAHEYYIGSPSHIVDLLRISQSHFIVIMSHHFSKDQEFLHAVLNFSPAYIGILGSKERTRRLLPDPINRDHIHYPIGLPIGAQGPEEIAVSIMAEIIQTYRMNHGK